MTSPPAPCRWTAHAREHPVRPPFPSVESVRVPLRAGALDLDVYVDTTSVEVFAQRGTHAITDLVFPNPSSTAISVDSDGGRTHLRTLTVTTMD